jgi:hypothetical protein
MAQGPFFVAAPGGEGAAGTPQVATPLTNQKVTRSMKPMTQMVVIELFASQGVQSLVQMGQYTPQHIARQSLEAAGAFADVSDDVPKNLMKVAIAGYTALVAPGLVGGTKAYFTDVAAIAIANAKTLGDVLAGAATQADESSQQQASGSESSQQSSQEQNAQSVPVEQLGLPAAVVELLMTAGLTDSAKVLAADASGDLGTIKGITATARKKILDAISSAAA